MHVNAQEVRCRTLWDSIVQQKLQNRLRSKIRESLGFILTIMSGGSDGHFNYNQRIYNFELDATQSIFLCLIVKE